MYKIIRVEEVSRRTKESLAQHITKYIKDEIKDDEFVESIKYFTYRDEPTPSVAYVQVAKIIKE